MPLAAEFAFIARHFASLAGDGALGLLDDAAVLSPPPGRSLVVAADAMVENVHFREQDPPIDLGRKLLRANLSDLAAMGADPIGYLLTLAVPTTRYDDAFFSAFAAGLARDQAEFGVTLLGGDTTATAGPFVMSLTILGGCPVGGEVRRSGARPGDAVLVTGTIGDGALGLRALRGEIADPGGVLADRYHLPRPRLGVPLAGLATAAIDVSDGLLQDAEHLARAGGVVLVLEADDVPLSEAARAAGREWRETCLTGGDDYELLFTVSPADVPRAHALSARSGIPITVIGTVRAGGGDPDVILLQRDGAVIPIGLGGYSHF